MLAAGLLSSFLLGVALGRPASDPHVLVTRSQRDAAPSGFIKGGPPSDSILQLSIALPQSNMPGLHAALLDISDPASANYGKHLSVEEVSTYVAPKPESHQAVTNWLNKNGITAANGSASGDTLTIHIPVEKANTLLAANFTTFTHEQTNTPMIRTLSYSLPQTLLDHIEFVYPTTHFQPPVSGSGGWAVVDSASIPAGKVPTRRDTIPGPECEKLITPACLFALYNIPSEPATNPNNNLVVSGLLDDFPVTADLQLFLATQRADQPDLANTPPYRFVKIGQAVGPEGTSEASADVQYTVGMATGVPVTYVSDGGAQRRQDYIDYANFLVQQDPPPFVLTTSYGFQEDTDDASVELSVRMCNAFAQLGARGTSVLFAAGDSGVAGTVFQKPQCRPDNTFQPSFPATCPYITAVGGTTGINPEVASKISSGGFSNIFPRPAYQDTAVETYLSAIGATNAGLFNTTGRAFPDVALQAENYVVQVNGDALVFVGTSAAAPVFASVIALLNDRLLNAGKDRLGFLNPLLYSGALDTVFNDITQGSNPGCGTDGFPAMPGWDAVTGFGSVDFGRFLAAVMQNPPTTTTPSPAPGSPSSGVPQNAVSQTQSSAPATATGQIGTTSASAVGPGQTESKNENENENENGDGNRNGAGATYEKGLPFSFVCVLVVQLMAFLA